jgi:hypothetical protein
MGDCFVGLCISESTSRRTMDVMPSRMRVCAFGDDLPVYFVLRRLVLGQNIVWIAMCWSADNGNDRQLILALKFE